MFTTDKAIQLSGPLPSRESALPRDTPQAHLSVKADIEKLRSLFPMILCQCDKNIEDSIFTGPRVPKTTARFIRISNLDGLAL